MSESPTDIKAKRADRLLEVTWADRGVVRYPFRFLRGECPCAGCVDEFTGTRTLNVSTIPDDVSISDISLVGSYAVKISWTDGHDTGLYTWTKLRELAGRVSDSA